MRERPILFSGPMVRAILEGRKTQTRRVLRPQPPEGASMLGPEWFEPAIERWDGALVEGKPVFGAYDEDGEFGLRCPYGAPGDRLWVRETWAATHKIASHEYPSEVAFYDWDEDFHGALEPNANGLTLFYRADARTEDDLPAEFSMPGGSELRWRPSIHMPRWASRLLLEVTEVRVQRLQEITEEDAKGEGVGPEFLMDLSDFLAGAAIPESTHRNGFRSAWREINGPDSWDANPWVWCLSFRRVEVERG